MHASLPVNRGFDLLCILVVADDNFVDCGTQQAFAVGGEGARMVPESREICRKLSKLLALLIGNGVVGNSSGLRLELSGLELRESAVETLLVGSAALRGSSQEAEKPERHPSSRPDLDAVHGEDRLGVAGDLTAPLVLATHLHTQPIVNEKVGPPRRDYPMVG